ncbi:hypothetical protein ACMFMG_011824 [Clarireedia jacksonii]
MDAQCEASAQAVNNSIANQPLQTKINNLIGQIQQQQQYDQPNNESVYLRHIFVKDIWPFIHGDYHEMTKILKEFLETSLKEVDISAEVSGRAKEVDSVKKTLKRRESYLLQQTGRGFENIQEVFYEMHDLSGLRIVLDYREDHQAADSFIQKTFKAQKDPIDFDPNREIGQSWRQPWFGAYKTRNHRVSLAENTTDLSQYTNVMFEIQLTTFSDDLYNKLAHDLLYKGKPGSLTPQEEMVIDLSHGVTQCFELCLRILRDKLKGDSHKAGEYTEGNADISSEIENTLGPRQAVEARAAIEAFEQNARGIKSVPSLPGDSFTREERWESIIKRLEVILEKHELDPLRSTKAQACLADLRPTDPRHDKKRIEDTKGGLLEGLYNWILENSDFRQWRNDQQSRLLWIKGDPGKGKTMLLCGVINELGRSRAKSILLSYFFCQATDSRINSATAVLRGLIYLLVDQQPSLISHIQTKYDQAGKTLFEDTNAWIALSEIFMNILQDPSLDYVNLIVDALDECVADLPKLLDFIVQTSSISPCIKWIISSRNWPNIEKTLDTATQKLRLCLELNEKSISAAVATFIQFKVKWLAKRNKYSNDTQEAVQLHLTLNANGTFLWVALVCQELSNISGWKARQKLIAFPPGLDALYQRMLDQIMNSEDAELCKSILAIVSAVYRPVTLDELVAFVDMPDGVAGDYEALSEIIGLCGSFLTLRGRTIFFVHQSAKDFLIKRASKDTFLPTINNVHSSIFLRSLQAMSRILRRDVYNLRAPGISIDQVKPPDPDPLAAIQYSCLYWVDHLLDSNTGGNSNDDLKDSGSVYKFLTKSYLYWLEALSLMRSLANGILMIRKLEDWVQANESPNLYAFINDAKRFDLYSRSVIEQTPLQAYCSALVFAPEKSIVRTTFENCIPPWIQKKPIVEPYWNAILQTLEGHMGSVNSVAFSPDGKLVVSGSHDKTVRLWDTATGQQIQPTLEGHMGWVNSVAFSPDGKQVVSGSHDNTVRLWDTATGQQIQPTLEGHTDRVYSVAFSPDGKQVVSGSYDKTVRLWDTATGQQIQPTLEDHMGSVNSVAFSPDGKQVVSGSWDKTVRLWDTATGQQIQPTLEGHMGWVNSVAFSPDGKQVVSGSLNNTVQLWDTATGQQIQPTLEDYTSWVTLVAFSPDGKQVVSGSLDKTVRLWDTATGQQIQPTLKGHTSWVTSVAFSPNGKQVVSGSTDNQMLPLTISNDWVIEDGVNILWLPSEYRTTVVAIYRRVVVLGQRSGRISFFAFTYTPKFL